MQTDHDMEGLGLFLLVSFALWVLSPLFALGAVAVRRLASQPPAGWSILVGMLALPWAVSPPPSYFGTPWYWQRFCDSLFIFGAPLAALGAWAALGVAACRHAARSDRAAIRAAGAVGGLVGLILPGASFMRGTVLLPLSSVLMAVGVGGATAAVMALMRRRRARPEITAS